MAELQAGSGVPSPSAGGPSPTPGAPGAPGGSGGGDDAAQKQAAEDERRRTMMSQILSPEARERRQSPFSLSPHVRTSRVTWPRLFRLLEFFGSMLTQELASAHAVSRIALVKPDRARSIEQLLARMAQSGQIRGRVTEDQLIDVLDQVSAPLILSHFREGNLTLKPAPSLNGREPQVEAMEKGQGGGGAAKSASKITVSVALSHLRWPVSAAEDLPVGALSERFQSHPDLLMMVFPGSSRGKRRMIAMMTGSLSTLSQS